MEKYPSPKATGMSGNNYTTAWQSPSNIALVKYWGKYPGQFPANPSISFTLDKSHTRTSVEADVERSGSLKVEFSYDGKPAPAFEDRIVKTLRNWEAHFPFLANSRLRINTVNSFPHSAGIASSASAMSALALCIGDIEARINGDSDENAFRKKASFIARLGSGSAARSVYPYAALWGASPGIPLSSDEYAIPLEGIAPVFKTFRDSILIVDPQKKEVSSSEGHALMEGHPFAPARFQQAEEHCLDLLDILKNEKLSDLVSLVEKEALTLHALMMSSSPGYLLMKGGTIEIIQRIRQFREQSGIPTCFTLDAGPNVHLLYPEKDESDVRMFIEQELQSFCKEAKVIHDRVGSGPSRIK